AGSRTSYSIWKRVSPKTIAKRVKATEVAEEEREEFDGEKELKALQGVWNCHQWTTVIRGNKFCCGDERGYLKVIGKKGDILLVDLIHTDSMREGIVDRFIIRREGNTLHGFGARNEPRPAAFPDPTTEGYHRYQLWAEAGK